MLNDLDIKKPLRKEGLTLVLSITFLFMTLAFIYNESLIPTFRATSRVQVRINSSDTAFQKISDNFYLHQARLKQHIEAMLSDQLMHKLAMTPELIRIVHFEFQKQEPQKSWLQPLLQGEAGTTQSFTVSTAEELARRIKTSLSIEIDPKDSTLTISSNDKNPKLATAIVNALPALYRKLSIVKDTSLRNRVINISQEIHQSVNSYLMGDKKPHSDLQLNASTIQEQINSIWIRQWDNHTQINGLMAILTDPIKALPKGLKDQELTDLQNDVIKNELKYAAISRGKLNDKKITGQLGMSRARFNRQIKSKIETLSIELGKLQKTEKDLLATLSNQKADMKNQLVFMDNEDQVFEQLLGRQNLISFFDQPEVFLTGKASEPNVPFYPNKALNLVLGGLAGLFLGLMFNFLINIFRTRKYISYRVQKDLEFKLMNG